MDSGGAAWSTDVGQADWIAGRLTPWNIRPFGDDHALRVTTVVPGGFERYARVLHPAYRTATGGRETGDQRVRWAEVAAWSGLPLSPRAGFHTVALPPARRPDPVPFADGPRVGTLDFADATVLADVLRGWTSTPDDCWFCLWNGFGWEQAGAAAGSVIIATRADGVPLVDGTPVVDARLFSDPVPADVRHGRLVRLPNREYVLYRGPAAAVTVMAAHQQTANLGWPADRAWCLATEIDLQSSYVGGPAGLIDALVGDPRIEAVPAQPDDPVSLVLADWVTAWIDDLTSALLADGEATLDTARGTVRARLRRPPRDGATPLGGGGTPSLHIEVNGDDGSQSSSDGRARSGDPAELRRHIVFQLTHAILGLAPEE